MFRKLMTAAAFCGAAGGASAEGWTIADLGETVNRDNCLIRAEQMMYRYIRNYGGGNVYVESWTVYGYDLGPGDNDAVIMCPYVRGTLNAFVVVHGETSTENRQFVSDTMQRYWTD